MKHERADELLAELGSIIIGSKRLANEDWSSLAVVVICDGGWSVSGLHYNEDDEEPTPFLPDEEFDDLIPDFYDATLVADLPGWLSCLFQIKRADMQIRILFEYEDATRWKIIPSNRKALAAALRPV